MSPTITPYIPADRDAWLDLLADRSLRRDLAMPIALGEMDDPLAHPLLHPGGMWLARAGGSAIGFAMLLMLPSAHGPWAMIRLGVRAAHRRRGVGVSLFREVERALADLPSRRAPLLLAAGAWLPADDARGFLERLGFRHYRYWWSMERPLGPVAAPKWPVGLKMATYDGSELALREWTDCYNDAFSERFPSHLATEEEGRRIAGGPLFRADGLLLAWDGERCLGFCRNTIFPEHAEVDVLGVRAEARGRGLGRALLRWGVAWLQAQKVRHVRLIVDGENEKALQLYRAEGFDVEATREMWMRQPAIPRSE